MPATASILPCDETAAFLESAISMARMSDEFLALLLAGAGGTAFQPNTLLSRDDRRRTLATCLAMLDYVRPEPMQHEIAKRIDGALAYIRGELAKPDPSRLN